MDYCGEGQRVCWPPSQIIKGPGPPAPPPILRICISSKSNVSDFEYKIIFGGDGGSDDGSV